VKADKIRIDNFSTIKKNEFQSAIFSDSDILGDTNAKKKKIYVEDKIVEEKDSSQVASKRAMKSILNIQQSPIAKSPSVSRFSAQKVVHDEEEFDNIHNENTVNSNTSNNLSKEANDPPDNKPKAKVFQSDLKENMPETNDKKQTKYEKQNNVKENTRKEVNNIADNKGVNNIDKSRGSINGDIKGNVNKESSKVDINKNSKPLNTSNQNKGEEKDMKKNSKEDKKADKKENKKDDEKKEDKKGGRKEDKIDEKKVGKSENTDVKRDDSNKVDKKIDKKAGKKSNKEEDKENKNAKLKAKDNKRDSIQEINNQEPSVNKSSNKKATNEKVKQGKQKETYSDEEVEYDADVFKQVLNESLFSSPEKKEPKRIKRKHKDANDFKDEEENEPIQKPPTKRKKVTESEYIKRVYQSKDNIRTTEVALPIVEGETFGNGRYPKRHRIPRLDKFMGEKVNYVHDPITGAFNAETVFKINPYTIIRSIEIQTPKKRLRKGLKHGSDDELEEEVIKEDIEDGMILIIPSKRQKKPHKNYGCILKCEIIRPSNKYSINIEEDVLTNLKKGEKFTIKPYQEFNFVNQGSDELRLKFTIDGRKNK
jgi:hypothetical protein